MMPTAPGALEGRGLRRSRRRLILIAFLTLVPALPGASAPGGEEPETFLAKHGGFSRSDTAQLNRGEPVATILESTHDAELPALGVIRVRASIDLFLARYRDIAAFKKGEEVLAIGKFSAPPRIEDLRDLVLDPGEVDSLKSCRVGDCGLKMPGAMIERFRSGIDWSSPGYEARANALYREMLLGYVRAYLQRGDAELATYRDKKDPVHLRDQFLSLVRASPYMPEYVPEFTKYLESFPAERPHATEEFLYWSKEKFGFKPVVSITHVIVCRPPAGRAAFIASKQIYANHYFIGSLGLAAFVEAPPGDGARGSYLMYLNRSRVDLLQGFLSSVKRFFVKRRVRGGMEKYLKLVRTRLESAAGATADR